MNEQAHPAAGEPVAVNGRGLPFWTPQAEGLGTGLVSYESAISREFHEDEREAVFRRSWLYMGRVDKLRTPGSYFTRELDVLDTSLIIVRGRDREVRAFHNTCPHRGNKLVWEGHPAREVSGRCMRFVCKYHGLGFGPDGKIEVLTAPTNWFDGQGDALALAQVPLEIVSGFIFVNLEKGGPTKTLHEFLGERHVKLLSSFQFEKMTSHFSMTGTTKSNWKTLQDAFSEGYHAGSLHKYSFPFHNENPNIDLTPYAVRYDLSDPHRSSISPEFPDSDQLFPIGRLAKASGIGPQYRPSEDLSFLDPVYNPDGTGWAAATTAVFPNMQMHIYYPGWFLTYSFWPLAYDEMRFDIDFYFPEIEKFSDSFSQMASLGFIYDAFLQDLSTLEATQRGLRARAFEGYPLCDEEIQVRHFHKMIYDAVARYRGELHGG